MRLVKILGLATVVAAIATGFVGTTSASALYPAQLCKVHTGLVCPAGQATTEDREVLAPLTVWKLLTNVINVLCLYALKRATPLELGDPELVHTAELYIAQCGTNAAHTNCTVTAEELPLLHLLKTGLDQGVLAALTGILKVDCTLLDCEFSLQGLELEMGNQHTTAFKAPIELFGGLLCPTEASLDELLVTLEDHFILQ